MALELDSDDKYFEQNGQQIENDNEPLRYEGIEIETSISEYMPC